ncbi:hypothetical protein AMEX_G5128 [Astyanax mexicanus]|uniref:Uncharacterized protein n=1 Tax=Astyanax mexicanus TaxID=7994 RepID=A0A8T2MCL0_ASTMX|nr:hypothetical protein AMEX_G5128 [Astyanax mexicanus]
MEFIYIHIYINVYIYSCLENAHYIFQGKNNKFTSTSRDMPTVMKGSGFIIIWGCSAASVRGNIAQMKGKCTKYQQILNANVKAFHVGLCVLMCSQCSGS